MVYYLVVAIRKQRVPLYLKSLMKSQYLPADELISIQLNKLRILINHTRKSVPFYMREFKNMPYEIITKIDDINRLPFLTKEMIKKRSNEFVSRNRYYLLTKKITGGSTGEPVTILKDSDAMARELAATWRGYNWAGIDIGDKQGRLWGIPFGVRDRLRAKLIDIVANRRRCSAFSFDEQHLNSYTNMLKLFKPKYLYGYVSMIEEYAKYFQKKKIIPPFNLRCIITTSEVLTDYHRKFIEQVFSTKVFNEYGSGELGSVAHECEQGSLHLIPENMIVEILDGERTCKPGEVGELVITELNNPAMPLIRYRTGDFASISPKPCSCGRTLPVIEKLFGRAYDTIRNRDGKMFHGEFFVYIFEEAKRKNLGVDAFQVVQKDYSKFNIKIVAGLGYSRATEEFVKAKFFKGLDPKAKIDFELVEKIEREPSGKMRVVVGLQDL